MSDTIALETSAVKQPPLDTTTRDDREGRALPTSSRLGFPQEVGFFIRSSFRRCHNEAYRFTRAACRVPPGRVGVWIWRKPRSASVGMDLWRADFDLTRAAQDKILDVWGKYSRRVWHRRRKRGWWASASKTGFGLEILQDDVEEWKTILAGILSDPDSYEEVPMLPLPAGDIKRFHLPPLRVAEAH